MVYGVRVLSCLGSGSTSGVVDGMNWVAENGARPAVASMSLGGGASSTIDRAVTTLHNSGVVVSVAAGNSNANACNYSPARAAEAITVGATDIRDSRASFSNLRMESTLSPLLSISTQSVPVYRNDSKLSTCWLLIWILPF